MAQPLGDVDLMDRLAEISLFMGLSRAQLESIAHTFDEQWFGPGDRVLRQGLSGSGLFVILDGDASVVIDGQERARLSRGDFFGEVSALLEEPPTADVVAGTELRCLVLGSTGLDEFLLTMPQVTLRMLKSETRRLRTAVGWKA